VICDEIKAAALKSKVAPELARLLGYRERGRGVFLRVFI